MELQNLVPYACQVIEQRTPDGTLYLTIIEDQRGKPIRINAEIGKSGAGVRAWCDAFSRLACLLLDNGGTLESIMDELSNITTDKSVVDSVNTHLVTRARSGPEGVSKAIAKYKKSKYDELMKLHNKKEVGTFLERD